MVTTRSSITKDDASNDDDNNNNNNLVINEAARDNNWTVRDFYTLIAFSAYVEPIQNCAIFTLPLRFCFGNLDICYRS